MKKLAASLLFLSISLYADNNQKSWYPNNLNLSGIARETAVAFCYSSAMSAVILACETPRWHSIVTLMSSILPILYTAHAIKNRSAPVLKVSPHYQILIGALNAVFSTCQLYCLLTRHTPRFYDPFPDKTYNEEELKPAEKARVAYSKLVARSFQGRVILHHLTSIPCALYVAYTNIKAGLEELKKQKVFDSLTEKVKSYTTAFSTSSKPISTAQT